MRSILKRLFRRHTTAVAYLALFAALGGSAYAAITVTGENIVDGTVMTADLASGAVTEAKLGGNAVTGPKALDESLTGFDLKDGSLGGRELTADTVTSDKVKDGALTGLDIMDNTVTSSELNVSVKQVAVTSDAYDESPKEVPATCPSGYTVLGGGGRQNGGGGALSSADSYPTANGWHVAVAQPIANLREHVLVSRHMRAQ
jgi:hypothetical protein